MDSKKGFTLVELSIVLVIIGLLIGGILAAQSMISTAKIQALVRQVGQFDAAEANFETKYSQMPGDNNLMGTVLGDNNRIITGSGFASNFWGGEIAKYWSDLSNSGLTNPDGTNYPDNSAGGSNLTVNTSSQLPQAMAGNKGFFIAFGTSAGNYYMIGAKPGGNGASTIYFNPGAFTPVTALAIDSKIDDGIANSGNALADDNGGIATYMNNSPITTYFATCTTQPNGAQYNVSNPSSVCNLVIRLGNATGDLK